MGIASAGNGVNAVPKFRVRTIMVVVAVVGLGIGVYQWLVSRTTVFERRVQHAAFEHQIALERSAVISIRLASLRSSRDIDAARAQRDHLNDELAKAQAKEAYYTAIARKYLRAARYPWLPVAPDPPSPK